MRITVLVAPNNRSAYVIEFEVPFFVFLLSVPTVIGKSVCHKEHYKNAFSCYLSEYKSDETKCLESPLNYL
jgi:hypothetical protein